jgi:hypothetical protein
MPSREWLPDSPSRDFESSAPANSSFHRDLSALERSQEDIKRVLVELEVAECEYMACFEPSTPPEQEQGAVRPSMSTRSSHEVAPFSPYFQAIFLTLLLLSVFEAPSSPVDTQQEVGDSSVQNLHLALRTSRTLYHHP